MALTEAQLADVRRFAGYPLAGTTMLITDFQDTVYMKFGMVTMSLHQRLTSLNASEESVLISTYLTPLYSLETAITGSSDNADTAQAAVWVRNPAELAERNALFDQWRRRMCGFLGLKPGPGLGDGAAAKIVRC